MKKLPAWLLWAIAWPGASLAELGKILGVSRQRIEQKRQLLPQWISKRDFEQIEITSVEKALDAGNSLPATKVISNYKIGKLLKDKEVETSAARRKQEEALVLSTWRPDLSSNDIIQKTNLSRGKVVHILTKHGKIRPRKVPEHEIEQIKEFLRTGASDIACSRKFNRSYPLIRKIRELAGIATKRKRSSEQARRQAIAMVLAGRRPAEIRKATGVSESWLFNKRKSLKSNDSNP